MQRSRARALGLIPLVLLLVLAAVAPAMAKPDWKELGDLPPGLQEKEPPGLGKKGELPPGLAKGNATITFLHHNDGESELSNVARFATVVAEQRAAASGSLNHGSVLVSAGDNYLAGKELNASFDSGFDPFYDALAMDLIGYDALIIGNHEFDFGPDVLEEFVRAFSDPVPVLSANLDFSAEAGFADLADADGPIAHSTVVYTAGRAVGIVGATTENLPFISSPRDVVVNDVAPAVQAEIDGLTADGVDIIVLAAHLQGLNSDEALIAQLSGVDVAIAGGGDELLANDGDVLQPGDSPEGPYPTVVTDSDDVDVPVVTGPGDFQYLGALTVEFDGDGEVVSWDGGPIAVLDDVTPDPTIQALVVDPVEAFTAELDAEVIGTSEVALEGRRPDIRITETNEGNLMADALLWQATQLAADFGLDAPDVAVQNGGGIRNNSLIPAGDITTGTTFDIAPFSNFVTVFPELPRSVLLDVLENAVSQVENVSGRFAHVAGMSFTYDSSAEAGARIGDVTVDGIGLVVEDGAVVPGDPISFVTIDFLARGGDQYPLGSEEFVVLGASYQQALANYIVDGLGGVISSAQYPEGGEGRIVDTGGLPAPS